MQNIFFLFIILNTIFTKHKKNLSPPLLRIILACVIYKE